MSRYQRIGSGLLALVMVIFLGTAALASFSDTAGHWAEAQIDRIAALGFVGGYPDGTFRPDNPVTRAEAVTIIDRIITSITPRIDRLEAQAADRSPAVMIDNGLAVKFEEISHSVDEERLAINVQGFVRNRSREVMPFNPSQVVLLIQNEAGETVGMVRPRNETDAMRLAPGEGRQVRANFVIEGEELADAQMANLVVGVIDSGGQPQAARISIKLECSWPPLRCRLTITINF